MKFGPETTVEEVLEQSPDAARVFVELGLPCFVCGEPVWGTVAELCAKHGKDTKAVLEALNRVSQS